jgi:hypothetical protein
MFGSAQAEILTGPGVISVFVGRLSSWEWWFALLAKL